jgi:hypothetical protein
VQSHEFSFVIEATPEEIWSVLHPRLRAPTVMKHDDVVIDVQFIGDETGKGLVRRCEFRVPRWLLSGGLGRSWEVVTESDPGKFSSYRAISKPLWSEAVGWHRLEDLGDGRTKVSFGETYHAFNPISRVLLEKTVHRFISGDNDKVLRDSLEQGIAARRARRAAKGAS